MRLRRYRLDLRVALEPAPSTHAVTFPIGRYWTAARMRAAANALLPTINQHPDLSLIPLKL